MKRISQLLAMVLMLGIATTSIATPKITKVLPHLLDENGQHTISPSLLERDAYQAQLRKNPELCSGIRFDIKWSKGKRKNKTSSNLKLQVELQTSASNKPIVLTKIIKLNKNGGWDSLKFDDERYKKSGKIIAWRTILLEDNDILAERKSFLWQMKKRSNNNEVPSAD